MNDQAIADQIVNTFTKAASIEHPLQLRSFKLKGIKIHVSEVFLPFLRLLQSSPLHELALQLFSEHSWLSHRIPATISFKSLRSLRITSCITLEDIFASTPNLKAIHLDCSKRRPPNIATLKALTQPSLTHFTWGGMSWATSLLSIPAVTLNQLTCVAINCTSRACPIEQFEKPLSQLHSLVSLTLFGECETFVCKNIDAILGYIPSKLRVFRFSVQDWSYDEIKGGLSVQDGLKEVMIKTDVFRSDLFVFGGVISGRDQSIAEARRLSAELHIPKVEFRGSFFEMFTGSLQLTG
ncbi:hypothetical protein HDV00_006171 [Rhizophlyctis rosea]|nr:hypothetical protein HDV00_006171 [Rhizophlyctis rosea]